MILKQLSVKYFGPFAVSTTIDFDPAVTVLTGANDTGKSSLLSLIEILCRIQVGTSMTERDVNIDRLTTLVHPWDNDPDIFCEATFVTTSFSGQYVLGGPVAPGIEMILSCHLSPKVKGCKIKHWRKQGDPGWSTGGPMSGIKTLPNIIRMSYQEPIRSVIDITNPNALERRFLQVAFSPEFKVDHIATLTESGYLALLSSAQARINNKLSALLPPPMKMTRLVLKQLTSDKRAQLVIHMEDAHSGYTPLDYRGSGLRHILSALSILLSNNIDTGHHIVLFDEPETSLHADAQHSLRLFLENIGARENIQVIYATHSPCMINAMRPQSIRLLQRTTANGVATSRIVGAPHEGNFLPVRSSLGIYPADSLIFGLLTVIVEGPTEVIGIPLILERLCADEVEGFTNATTLLSQCHFVDGSGDSFEYMCRIAKGYMAKPLLFLDGDKTKRIKTLREKHADVPIILLEPHQEFEDLIPPDVYITALAQVIGDEYEVPTDKITYDAFAKWELTAGLPEQMMFTKRIDRWLEATATGTECYRKPAVMKQALDSVLLHQVKTAKLLELVDTMKGMLPT